jgi:hypothetical protein
MRRRARHDDGCDRRRRPAPECLVADPRVPDGDGRAAGEPVFAETEMTMDLPE